MTEVSNQLQFLIDGSCEGIYYTDAGHRILYWNKYASELTGYTAADTVGKQCRDGIVKHVDHKGRSLCSTRFCPLVASGSNDQTYHANLYLHHSDGHLVSVAVRAIRNTDGRTNLLGIAQYFVGASDSEKSTGRQSWKHEAITDALTGLGNRRSFQEQWKRTKRHHHGSADGIGLLILDIDHFKGVNDQYGHNQGDKVLRSLAKTLVAGVRNSDQVFRWGGEEFVLIVAPASPALLNELAERLRKLVEQTWTMLPDSTRLKVTVSVGGAVLTKNETAKSLLDRADKRLLHCKQNGRNCVSIDTDFAGQQRQPSPLVPSQS